MPFTFSREPIEARLAKDGRRIMCGHPSCRLTLARIGYPHVAIAPDDQGAYLVVPMVLGDTATGIRFTFALDPRLMRGPDGVYRFHSHALKRIAKGLRPRSRRRFSLYERGKQPSCGTAFPSLYRGPLLIACPHHGVNRLYLPDLLGYPVWLEVETEDGGIEYDPI